MFLRDYYLSTTGRMTNNKFTDILKIVFVIFISNVVTLSTLVFLYSSNSCTQPSDTTTVTGLNTNDCYHRPSILSLNHNIRMKQQQLSSNHHHHGNNNEKNSISIAFIGNSMLYYNDCPRLVQQMIIANHHHIHTRHHNDGVVEDNNKLTRTDGRSTAATATISSTTPHYDKIDVYQDSCLRGGASISSLLREGNGMQNKFQIPQSELLSMSNNATDNSLPSNNINIIGSPTVESLLLSQHWDYLVMNDFTQGPARDVSRQETIVSIKEKLVPMLISQNTTTAHAKMTIPIIIQTPAYRRDNIKGSDDLGDFTNFSNLLAIGVHEYQKAFYEALMEGIIRNPTTNNDNDDSIPKSATVDVRIAPVGEGYRYLYKHNNTLWYKLYSWDEHHPTPAGTWFEACIIYCTMYPHHYPPNYNPLWWNHSRYMMPAPEGDLYYQVPYPTIEDANELHRVAYMISNNDHDNNKKSHHQQD